MKVLALDISTSAGWALLEGEPGNIPKIIETGVVANDQPVSAFGQYPWSTMLAASAVADRLRDVVAKVHLWEEDLDAIVVEEINKPGRFGNRYSQKLLDFLHYAFLYNLRENEHLRHIPVIYINTSDWRRVVGANLTKADKALNIKVRKLKKAGDKEGLKKLGVRGKVSKKHAAIRFVNQTFGLSLKAKDDDIADAICQGTAYFLGVPHCDGK